MPPSPRPSSAFCLATLLSFFTTHTTCSSFPPPTAKTLCPPFNSPPPYPFSFSTGCGHPSFQLHCPLSSSAVISINNFTFSLVHYEPNSTSVTLSPTSPPHPRRNCTLDTATISALSGPISFSGSSFRISDSSCSRLSILEPCPPPNLPNCTHCSLECELIKNPIHLIHDCGVSSTRHMDDFQPECQTDVLGVLDNILRMGFEVEWDEDQDNYFTSCRLCKSKNGFCGFDSSVPENRFICFPPQARAQQKSPDGIAILLISSMFMCLLIVLSVAFVLFHYKTKALSDSEEDPTIIFLRRHRSVSLLPPVFTYEELDLSTHHFDPKRKIGDGGFGSVYLGQLHDGGLVAVKHLHKHNSEKGLSNKSFCNEIFILSSINHPNLVRLHGYCSDPRGLLLVYDYVPNGTLADHLHGKHSSYRKVSLNWNTRIDIAFQTAMAIEYLHFSVRPPIVHRDITSSNIFVDKDMRVKVGDFGLSRLLVCSDSTMTSGNLSEGGVWTGPQGTPGYLDPDYYTSFRLNEKSDIYSFGVVLLELITGMRAVDQNRQMREMALADMVVPRIQMGLLHQVVDPALVLDGDALAEGVAAVAELAFRCVAAEKDDRPDACEVKAELGRIKGRGVRRGSNSSNAVVPDGG